MNTGRFAQFVRYCAVGAVNTAVTFAVIYLSRVFAGWNPYVCNVLGYAAGLACSFMLNKLWTFRSGGRYGSEALKFVAGFAVCYLVQLWTVWMLAGTSFGRLDYRIAGIIVSGYGIATFVGNIVYTLSNYVFNRLITFRNPVQD